MIWLSIGLTRFIVGHIGLPYSAVLGAAAFVRALRGAAADLRPDGLHPLCARRLVLRARFHPSRPPGDRGAARPLRGELVRIARETDADEIIVDGHSLGAPLSIVVVDRALKLDPELAGRGRPLHFVSSGSSLLKVALHPAAGWLREAVARVANRADLLGRISGAGRHHQCLQGRSGGGARPRGDRQADHTDHPHPADGRGDDLPELPSQFPAHPSPGDDGQRAPLLLRLLHALLRPDPARRAGRPMAMQLCRPLPAMAP